MTNLWHLSRPQLPIFLQDKPFHPILRRLLA